MLLCCFWLETCHVQFAHREIEVYQIDYLPLPDEGK
jgi:hypothetical protein